MNKFIIVGKFKTTKSENGFLIDRVEYRQNETTTSEIRVWIPDSITRPDPGSYCWFEGGLFENKNGFLVARVDKWRTLDGKSYSQKRDVLKKEELPF